ncbi:hypothetical protein ACFL6E_04330 [Candidatus Neomarinimicrobiota bacterium]
MKLKALFNRIFRRKHTGKTDKSDQDRVEQALAQKIMEDARRHRATTAVVSGTADDLESSA